MQNQYAEGLRSQHSKMDPVDATKSNKKCLVIADSAMVKPAAEKPRKRNAVCGLGDADISQAICEPNKASQRKGARPNPSPNTASKGTRNGKEFVESYKVEA